MRQPLSFELRIDSTAAPLLLTQVIDCRKISGLLITRLLELLAKASPIRDVVIPADRISTRILNKVRVLQDALHYVSWVTFDDLRLFIISSKQKLRDPVLP